ncbi:TnsA endonuclease N-terminal domain-containing protein [Bacillus sp. FJAT-53711]|uniref:TnsA endonuclease N-terminal domain-containing protein n=1 Tax=Bacillus yunxiaonensis TaxID=3127665 RepID=A0ABU8FPT4_9BACI
MGGKNYGWTETRINRYIKEGRGTGELERYKPWLKVDDVPSEGRQHKEKGWKTQREHHLMSDLEMKFFYLLEWVDEVVDIYEQYPLDIQATEQISKQKNIKHPIDNKTGVLIPFTTDFLIKVLQNGKIKYLARTVKPSEKLEDSRVLEKLEIEREYYISKEIDWGIVTEKELSSNEIVNISKFHSNYWLHAELEQYSCLFMRYFLEAEDGQNIIGIANDFDILYDLQVGSALAIFKHLMARKKILLKDMSLLLTFNMYKKEFKINYEDQI